MIEKILVVDDETPARKELVYLVNSLINDIQIFEARDGEEALHIINKVNIDAAFIDINMPDIDGISLAREIYEINNKTKIIFATAYDDYAIDAFELNAVDYILKPFEENRVKMAVEKLIKAVEDEDDMDTIKSFIKESEWKINKISVWKSDRVILIDVSDIIYIMADGRNTLIKTINGEFPSNQNLCDFERKLCNNKFLRIHRSYIINLEQVKEILPWFNNTYVIKMNKYEKDEIPISRKQIKTIREIFEF